MKSRLMLMALFFSVLPLMAQQSSFDQFRQQQAAQFNQFKTDKQAEYDAFRKRVNAEYAEFMRRTWESFPAHEADEPIKEQELPPVVYQEPEPQPAPQPKTEPEPKTEPKQEPQPQPKTEPKTEPEPEPAPEPKTEPQPQPQEDEKPQPQPVEEKPLPKESIAPITTPQPTIDTKPVQIAVQPKVLVIPTPQPAPEPIAPVKPKEEPYKRVSVDYFGTIITIGFPLKENLHLRALDGNAVADEWQKLAESPYDITVSTALNARKANNLCDWAYMKMLQAVTEKQYGKTNEAVLVQAFIMTQSGYRIRLGMSDTKLYMLVASQYGIFGYRYFTIDGVKFYNVNGDKDIKMQITQAKYGKEKSLSMQMKQLPQLNNTPTSRRNLTSKKGVTAAVSVNKNLIDFFNTYPQAYFNGVQTTRWAAYANTPIEKSVKDMLYPPLQKTIAGMKERDAVNILLNWVQTAFEYEYDDKVWGGDRAFFAQETLYYPYCDCEDRSILFSHLVRDLLGLDVVLLYYPGHLATAVAFNENVNGDYLTYNNRKYVVCDPTYINAGVGRTMPGMNNKQAQIIALQ